MENPQNQCNFCGGSMRVTKLTCEECEFSYEGTFFTPRLYRLSPEDQRFIELFVLSSGSLKKMAEHLALSYPTVRNRLDHLIERLLEEQEKDRVLKRKVLEDIEEGRIKAKKGIRIIDAL